MRRRYSLRSASNRRAVAASELAVCLPILVLLLLAMIEACTMIVLKQSLTVASYEGVRVALEPTGTTSQVQAAANGVLTDRRVRNGAVVVTPSNWETLSPGNYVTVTVSAPANRNSVIPGSFFRGKTLSAAATMMKEF